MHPIRCRAAWSVGAIIALGSCGRAADVAPPIPAEPRTDQGWAFSYPAHGPSARPLLDLRSLNEDEAGRTGFIKRTPAGDGFALGDGTPVRFWAIGSEVYQQPAEAIDAHVRFLAGLGVNMVRLHAQIAPKKGSQIDDVNQDQIDGIWRFVAAAKAQGIYVTISPYWAQGKDADRWGIEGYGSGDLWGVLFVEPKLQSAYKNWARALYSRPNPYTKIPLAHESAIAIIQVQNEDSLLFWTTMTLKPVQRARLTARFAGWLAKKYGSVAAASKAWDGAAQSGDDFAAGRPAIPEIWMMTQPQQGGMARRIADGVAFFAAVQRDFYAGMVRFYREELGCRQLINASNWRTADQARMDDIERWTYGAADVDATNRYFTGVHVGPDQGWRIDPGDRFTQTSALLDPRSLSINLKQVVGRPMLVTEGTWVAPLGYSAEGPFLISVYESLTGVDGYFWFSALSPGYAADPFFNFAEVQGQKGIWKWQAETPTLLGGFPAAALLYRKGMVRQAEPVVHEERALAAMWQRADPLIAEDPSFDPNRDRGTGPVASTARSGIDPLAFLVGPVEVKYDGDPAKDRVEDLGAFIDRGRKVVRGRTGEVQLDYGRGVCTVDAPMAQGACGFLDRAGPIRFRDVAIHCGNPYAAVLVVAMDDRPIRESRRVLVQVTTVARPTGWRTKPVEFPPEAGKPKVAGFEIVRTGKPPWLVLDTSVGLALKNPALTRATRLDTAGFAAADVPIKRTAGGLNLTLPPDAMYVILE